MSSSQKDSLWSLVNSLSIAERKYFKEWAHKQMIEKYKYNYEKLFDALLYWDKPYDELDFKKFHKNKSFIKNLAYEKLYLEKTILKVLRQYHSGKSNQILFQESIINYYLLLEKGLIELSEKALKEAKEIAQKTENIENQLLIEILNMGLYNGYKGSADESYSLTTTLLEKLSNEREAFDISIKLFQLSQHKQNNIAQPLYKKTKELLTKGNLSIKAEKSLITVMLDFHTRNENYKDAFNLAKYLVNKMENAPNNEFYRKMYLRGALYNFLEAASFAGEWDEFKSGLEKLKSLEEKKGIIGADLFIFITNQDIKYRIYTNQKKDVSLFIEEVESKLEKYESIILPEYRILLQMHLIYFLFFADKYSLCKKIIAETTKNYLPKPKDKYFITELESFEILCDVLVGDFTTVETKLRKINRRLKDESLNDEFFKNLFSLLKSLVEMDSRDIVNEKANVLNKIKPMPQHMLFKYVLLSKFL